jgi:hypothetical protein
MTELREMWEAAFHGDDPWLRPIAALCLFAIGCGCVSVVLCVVVIIAAVLDG